MKTDLRSAIKNTVYLVFDTRAFQNLAKVRLSAQWGQQRAEGAWNQEGAHAPCIAADAPGQVRKVVVKVKL